MGVLTVFLIMKKQRVFIDSCDKLFESCDETTAVFCLFVLTSIVAHELAMFQENFNFLISDVTLQLQNVEYFNYLDSMITSTKKKPLQNSRRNVFTVRYVLCL